MNTKRFILAAAGAFAVIFVLDMVVRGKRYHRDHL